MVSTSSQFNPCSGYIYYLWVWPFCYLVCICSNISNQHVHNKITQNNQTVPSPINVDLHQCEGGLWSNFPKTELHLHGGQTWPHVPVWNILSLSILVQESSFSGYFLLIIKQDPQNCQVFSPYMAETPISYSHAFMRSLYGVFHRMIEW